MFPFTQFVHPGPNDDLIDIVGDEFLLDNTIPDISVGNVLSAFDILRAGDGNDLINPDAGPGAHRAGPGDKTEMDHHPALVAILMTAGKCRFTDPAGATPRRSTCRPAAAPAWTPPITPPRTPAMARATPSSSS